MRLTSKVFRGLTISMVGIGLMVGALFPPLAVWLGVPSEAAWSTGFVVACLVAGALVGTFGALSTWWLVGTHLRRFTSHLQRVRADVVPGVVAGTPDGDAIEALALPVDADDAFGDGARAFNDLLDALAVAASSQRAYLSFTETLATRGELDDLATEALAQYVRHAHAVAGMVLFESAGELVLAASHGFADASSLVDGAPVMGVARGGVRRELASPSEFAVDGLDGSGRPHTVIIDPIVDRGVQLGVLVLASATGFDDVQRSRIDVFGRGLALALHTTLAHERLRRLTAIDALTGLLNRRFGLERLREEFGRAVRVGSPLGVLMVDVDEFKAVNDAYGHVVGDRVLRTVAHVARAALRDGDVLARVGGEEFLVVLPAAGAGEVTQVAERIRALVANATLVEGAFDVRVTLSIGGAAHPDAAVDSAEALLRLAEAALSDAKRSGRNRVRVAR